jgi:hypothetical protein
MAVQSGYFGRRVRIAARLGRRLALPSGRTPPILPEKHFEQIANPALLCLRREGVMQRKLGIHLVDVSPATSLANDVAVLDQLGDDPMGASLRDPHRLGDITQANAGVVRDAEQDLSVVRQELVLGHIWPYISRYG